ncbi:MAG: hypothetical protein ABSH21_08880 [Verrucomicrobiia bacterium]
MNKRTAAAEQTIAAPAAPATIDTRPEFCRPGQMPLLFGISRTQTYNYLASGEISGVNLRRPGCATGCRLINCQSVRDFLAREAAKNGQS